MSRWWVRVKHETDPKALVLEVEVSKEGHQVLGGRVEIAGKLKDKKFGADDFKKIQAKHGFDENETGLQIEEALEGSQESEGIF